MTRKAKWALIVSLFVLGSGAALLTYVDFLDFNNAPGQSGTQIRISELNYRDVSDEETSDFVEIENISEKEISLGGWCLKGLDFCFPSDAIIQPAELVVVRGSEFAGRMSNSGETIQLVDVTGNVIDEVTYSDSAPWPTSADGEGHSLHRLNVEPVEATGTTSSLDGADDDGVQNQLAQVSQWVADVPSPGMPYSPEFRDLENASADVVVNEIYYHPRDDNPADEFVELVNVSNKKISLDQWCIPEISRCFTGTDVLEPGAVFVVKTIETSSSLSNSNGRLRLFDADKKLHDVIYYSDNGLWPAFADGYGLSLHRRHLGLFGIEPGNWEAREPTPGIVDTRESDGYLPTFVSVSDVKAPTSTQEITLEASLHDGEQPQLHYKINFEPDVVVPMTQDIAGKRWRATIPAQPEGTLVRYRLVAQNGDVTGSWPRAGDGMVYRGTVVQSTQSQGLPRLQWFVEDDYYSQIYNDSGLFGDNGYPTVIAFDGEVFDGAQIRVRGNQSRLNNKKKWKVVLPPGYDTTLGGLLSNPVNEFALNSAFTDKSFVREILTSELQKLGGGIGQQIFPLRLEKNNQFYGLYLYQEQPDGRWREKVGFSDDVVAFKADRQATLRLNQLALPDSEMGQRYQRRTQRWLKHVDEIRELIRQVNNENQEQVLNFVYTSLDIPQIIETLATMRVAQHLELEHKNHMLFFDPEDQKWRFVPIDFDLNFGRQWVGGCNALCDVVSATPYMEYMEGNRLARLFLKIPELREMLDRRTKTLADAFLAEGYVEKRISELEILLREDAALDRKNWFTYGEKQTMQQAQKILIDNYVVPKRKLLTGPASPRLPDPQADVISYTMAGEDEVTITNTDSVVIDLSGIDLPTLKSQVPAGTVLRPGQSVVLSSQRTPHGGDVRQMRVWVPRPQ